MDEIAAERTHRQQRRFADDVYHAALHATPTQRLELHALVTSVRTGTITIADAHATVAHLRYTLLNAA